MKKHDILLPWADAVPPDAKERCLALELIGQKFALDFVECTAEKHVICEAIYSPPAAIKNKIILLLKYCSLCVTAPHVLIPAQQTYNF